MPAHKKNAISACYSFEFSCCSILSTFQTVPVCRQLHATFCLYIKLGPDRAVFSGQRLTTSSSFKAKRLCSSVSPIIIRVAFAGQPASAYSEANCSSRPSQSIWLASLTNRFVGSQKTSKRTRNNWFSEIKQTEICSRLYGAVRNLRKVEACDQTTHRHRYLHIYQTT